MKENSDNIEERLVPFVEGVLNEREEREVKEAMQADPRWARDIAELREVIDELRVGFASGLRPPQTELTPEEVVELSNHNGKLETMPGTSELKTRLFASDQALEEYRLLQELRKESMEATMDVSDVPPMPESLCLEFAKLQQTPRPRLEAVPARPGLWKRSVSYLDRINPRPLMAAAAAFALISLGVHFAGQPNRAGSAPESAVALNDRDTMGVSQSPIAMGEAPGAAGGSKVAGSQPSGVPVFTSSDKKLLREQAEKLLSNDIRYTVTDNRILVADKELAAARKVLWGEDLDQKVAMAEKTEGMSLSKADKKSEETPSFAAAARSPRDDDAGTDVERQEASPPPPVRTIDMRRSSQDRGSVEFKDSVDDKPASAAGYRSSAKEKAAPEPTAEASPVNVSGARVKRPEAPVTSPAVTAVPKNESPEERKERLRQLALGQSGGESGSKDAKADADDNVSITRSRTAPPVPVTPKQAPVANAVSADNMKGGVSKPSDTAEEVRGGMVAAQTTADAAPQPSTVDLEADGRLNQDETAGEVNNRPTSALRKAPAAPYMSSGSTAPSVAAAARPSAPAKRPDVSPIRLAAIREAQPAVARKYNVVLSIEQRGAQINVYVRPKGDLDKAQLDELRRAIRAELGLAPEDSIIFQ